MAEIMTVRGPIAPSELGFTSMHEHILCDASVFLRRHGALIPPNAPVALDDPIALDNLGILRHAFILSRDTMDLRDEELMAAEVSDFRATGGQAMVEMSAPGLRFDVAALRRICERTGVHIVATTGLYAEDSWPQRFAAMGVEDLAGFMRSEIADGIDGTGIRAGHIKVAITDSTAPGVTPFGDRQRALLKAAVRVSEETGLSLTVHPPLDSREAAREVVRSMRTEGMTPGRAVIAHAEMFFASQDIASLVSDPLASRVNVDFAKELLDEGFNVSIDSFGHLYDAEPLGRTGIADWQRLSGLIQLVDAGYSSRIVLGTDIYLKILTRRRGGEGYARLTSFVVPFLHRLGVAPERIAAMTVGNPARILSR
jgi:phosphotriesterase-related protein